MKNILLASMLMLAGTAGAQTINNWTSSAGPVKNSTGLCWRNGSWTPATAHPDCDGALVAPATVTAPVVPKAEVKTEAPRPEVIKTILVGDNFFDFDKAVIKPQGKETLNALVAKMQGISLEVVVVVGHTDSVGSDAYNLKLGARRAEAVKAYLVSKGIDKSRIYTESKGERQPIADNKTAAGRAKNRRVEVEVVGTQRK